MTHKFDPAITAVAALLARARRVFVVTGAGLSAESGLPTYRGVGGLYNDGATEDGMTIEAALSARTMASKPALTWKYVRQIERAVRGATFNAGHALIAAMESHFDRVLVLTQNVDGFHRDAGSRSLIEIHGNLRELRCTGCTHRRTVASYAGLEPVPKCDQCGAVLRPDIVLFNEHLPVEKVLQLRAELARGFDVYLSIGTTSAFRYIAQPLRDAAAAGVPTVEINPSTTAVSGDVAFKLSMGAAEALESIWAQTLVARAKR